MPSKFNDLVAYQQARALAADLYAAVLAWPAFDRNTVGEQLVRAADSVAANIAEATGRWSAADKRRILFIARGELCEVEHWLNVSHERGLADPQADRIAEIARTLNGLIKRPDAK